VERMLSVVATCRQREVKLLAKLTRCYQTRWAGNPARHSFLPPQTLRRPDPAFYYSL
jgi:hypothetical protein